MEKPKRKLEIELVPDSCWHLNLRTALPKKVWEMIKLDAKKRANYKCAICGKKTPRLEAHEKWSYDEKTGIQKLEDVISICHDCHQAIHIERTTLFGDIEKTEDHYMKVNNCTYVEMKKDRAIANQINERRNKIEWQTDTSWLLRFTEKKEDDN